VEKKRKATMAYVPTDPLVGSTVSGAKSDVYVGAVVTRNRHNVVARLTETSVVFTLSSRLYNRLCEHNRFSELCK